MKRASRATRRCVSASAAGRAARRSVPVDAPHSVFSILEVCISWKAARWRESRSLVFKRVPGIDIL
jgi:hypothetical protein